MNATIEKIVGLLFEDLQDTEETRAIREEVLRNCTERYQDLLAAGLSEDDAIAAVIESLNGMEEILSDYPRKQEAPSAEAHEETCACSFDPAVFPIREIRLPHMANACVSVCISGDELVHVENSNPKATLITGLSDGVLTVGLTSGQEEEELRFSLRDGFDLSAIGKVFEKLTKRFCSVGIRDEVQVTVSIPASLCPALHIGTASGNVNVESLKVDHLRINTASGDVEVKSISVKNELRVTSTSGDITLDGTQAEEMQFSATSGDICADRCSANAGVRINTTSGDIEWRSLCKTFDMNSVSGDLEMNGSAESITFRTVSGDAEIKVRDDRLLAISGSATSGDVNVHLPQGTQPNVILHTVSGDVCNHAGSVPSAPVTVKVSTVSGDIEVN